MGPAERPRRLVVTADDFGRTPAINRAVLQAHREGILTTASLMVTGEAAAEAIQIAREVPTLGVGLHLTLVRGRAACLPREVPGLVNAEGAFDTHPVRAGWRYFADRRLREPMRREIQAQFALFRGTGLPLDHVNGHLHFHLHPAVLPVVVDAARRAPAGGVRLTRDPLRLNLALARGRLLYRLSHAALFHPLSRHARPLLGRAGLRHTDAVFGLLQDTRVDEAFVQALLARLPAGDSELYCHPSLSGSPHELEALVSPRVRKAVDAAGIRLVRYQDL